MYLKIIKPLFVRCTFKFTFSTDSKSQFSGSYQLQQCNINTKEK